MKTPSQGIAFHERIRNRRQERRMAAYVLAEKVRVSPSYISLIERGSKIPTEEVAEAIARALDDDPDLYRAWARLAGSQDLGRTLTGADRLRRISTDASLRRQLVSGGNLDAARMGRVAKETGASAAAGLIEVPVLEEGADPGSGAVSPKQIVEIVRIDRRCLPSAEPVRPFAYRVGETGARRVRGMIEPGDLVVLTSRVNVRSPEHVHAVRYKGKIVLSRILLKPDAMLLLPAAGGSNFEVIPVSGRRDALKGLAGTVVLTSRVWSQDD